MTPCSVDGCENDAARGNLCEGHLKRRQRGMPVNAALAPRPSGIERLTEAALRYAAAEDDAEFTRARDNLRKAAANMRMGDLIGEWTREGMARAKANGVHVGRPPLVSLEVAREVVCTMSVKRASAQLGVSVRTVKRLRRAIEAKWLERAQRAAWAAVPQGGPSGTPGADHVPDVQEA